MFDVEDEPTREKPPRRNYPANRFANFRSYKDVSDAQSRYHSTSFVARKLMLIGKTANDVILFARVLKRICYDVSAWNSVRAVLPGIGFC